MSLDKKVSIEEKKEFLKWFLDHEELKHRGAYMILNYLHGHKIILDKVHFVQHADQSPRGIVIAAKSVDSPDFSFYKDGKVFHNPERAFHDIRLNWHHDIYVELQFEGAWMEERYLTVIEDNPYYSWNDHVPEEVQERVDHALDEFLYGFYCKQLMEEINHALENQDEEAFITFTDKLNQLKDQNNYCEDSPW